MKGISGGQTSVGADAKLLSSHAGDPRAATGDTTDTSQYRTAPPAGRQPVIESARRRPKDLPAGSDVTGPQRRDADTEAGYAGPPAGGLATWSRFPVAFPPPASLFGHPTPAKGSALLTVGPPTHTGPDPDGVTAFRTHELRPGWVPSIPRGQWCSPGRVAYPTGTRRFPAASP